MQAQSNEIQVAISQNPRNLSAQAAAAADLEADLKEFIHKPEA